MNRCDREGVKRARLDTRSDLLADAAAGGLGFDVLHRGAWTVPGAHGPVMEHLRERVALPGGAR